MKAPVQFGNYYLLERVAVGGMAEVYRAKSFGREGSERVVALKRILPMVASDKELVSMFIDEAKLVIQLNHPNICKVFDWGKVEDSYYLAMEYVSGCTLRQAYQRCKEQQVDGVATMPLAQACLIAMKLCEGLDYAHNKKDTLGNDLGLVHRDVSPPNVMVSYEGEVKLIDFGIAKVQTHRQQNQTEAGVLKGKFAYMSPEQVRGETLDRRSDIFSLGVVLYELLTGERLFPVDNDLTVLDKIRNVEILPPTSYNKRIPEELERIVMKALSRDPADRYQTAMDMHSELQQSLYASGEFYSRKELAAWMKRVFRQEFDGEQAALDAAREVRPAQSPSGSATEPLAKARQTMQIAALRVPTEGTGALRVPKDPTGAFRVGKDGPAGLWTGKIDGKEGDAPSSWTPSKGKAKPASGSPPPTPKQAAGPIAEAAAPLAQAARPRPPGVPREEDTAVDPQMLSGRVVDPGWSGESQRTSETMRNRVGGGGAVASAIDEGPTQGYSMQHVADVTGEQAGSDPGDGETRAFTPMAQSEAAPQRPAVSAVPVVSAVAAPAAAPPAAVERPPLVTPIAVPALVQATAQAAVAQAAQPASGAAPTGGPASRPPKPARPAVPVESPPVLETRPTSAPPPTVMPPPPLSLPPTLDVGANQAAKPQGQSRVGAVVAALLLLVVAAAGATYWMYGRGGELVISADPSREIIVLIDQKPVAMTDSPIVLKLQPGTYAVSVQHNGYGPWNDKLTIAAGETVKRTVKLEAIVHKTGGFTLVSDPPGASVSLDGASLGGVTPLRVQSVLVGPHTLEVRQGSRMWRQQVVIEEGKTSEIRATLPADDGTGANPTVTPLDPTGKPIVAVTPEVKPETKPEAVPEVKPETKPEVKPETKPEVKPNKPAVVQRPQPVRGGKKRRGPALSDTPAVAAGGGNFGYLRINSRPWSKIIVDGVDTGLNTPQISYRVTPGMHQVMLFNPQFNIRETIVIKVAAGETATITKNFQK